MTPWRSLDYMLLAKAPHARCLACGAPGPCDAAHYCGLYAERLGRGGGQKALDLTVPLCRECHQRLDAYKDGNDAERAAMFLSLVLQWLHMNLQLGHAELVVHSVVQRDPRPSREHKRRKQHSTATPSKVFPRPPSGYAR